MAVADNPKRPHVVTNGRKFECDCAFSHNLHSSVIYLHPNQNGSDLMRTHVQGSFLVSRKEPCTLNYRKIFFHAKTYLRVRGANRGVNARTRHVMLALLSHWLPATNAHTHSSIIWYSMEKRDLCCIKRALCCIHRGLWSVPVPY